MTSVWRVIACRGSPANGGPFSGLGEPLGNWLRYYFLVGLIGVVVLPGCAWVRAQAQHRSKECEELCSQANREKEDGRVAKADKLLDQALRKSPRDLEVQRQLADSLWEVGRHRDALNLLTRLSEEHPHDLRLAITLAEWHAELDHHAEALAWLQPALTSDPVSPAALELKARIESAFGHDDAALLAYQRLSQQEGWQAEAFLQMGNIYLQRGQPDRAAPLLRTVLALPQVTVDEQTAAQWSLGVAYAQNERWDDAAVHLAQASPRRDMTPDDWHAVAYAQFRGGQIADADKALHHALTLDPNHTATRKLIATIRSADSQPTGTAGALLPVSFERHSDAGHSLPPTLSDPFGNPRAKTSPR